MNLPWLALIPTGSPRIIRQPTGSFGGAAAPPYRKKLSHPYAMR